MAVAPALEALGAAISEEVRKEVQAVREELEQERQLRRLLEQQLLKLQQLVYPAPEIDQQLEQLSAKVQVAALDAVEAAGKDWTMKLQLAEQRLQASVEVLRSTEPAADATKRAAVAAEASPAMLTVEIDRKIGTAMVDLDQRFEAAKAAQAEALQASIRSALEETDAASLVRDAHALDLQRACQAEIDQIRAAMESRHDSAQVMGERLEAMQTSLEQKIGMVQLDVDQLRQEVGCR